MFTSVASERSVNRIAENIELSIARTRPELEQAFHLLYGSYVCAGLESPNELEMRLIRHHFLPTTDVMIAKDEGTTVSTASLIVDGELGLPAESMYGEEINALRRRGMRLGEVGCLADRRESPARFLHMLKQLSALLAQAAVPRGCDALIAATHPRHSRFYIRQLGFEQFGDVRDCPYVQGNPAVPLLFDFEKQKGTELGERLFAHKYSRAELAPYDWDEETRAYFESVFERLRPETFKRVDPPLESVAFQVPSSTNGQPH
jgi:hypothetical protein